jgi:ABC-2 type transport system permease protein
MKALAIALKDLRRSFFNASFLMFGFGIPLLMAVMFYFAFGGISGEDGGFDLPATVMTVANQDGGEIGQILVDVLQDEQLAELFIVTEVGDGAAARAAVDRQEADVAVILPENLSDAATGEGGRAAIELYHAPDLVLGPGIVQMVLDGVMDSFSGSRIAADVVSERLTAEGVPPDEATMESVAMAYAQWLAGAREAEGARYLRVQHVGDEEDAPVNLQLQMVSMVMAGMMVFYVFYSGALSSQSILQEEEAGTLSRLFTTATPPPAILTGKIIAALVTLTIQMVVLIVLSGLIFGIDWGAPWNIALVTAGTVFSASSLGLFITSFLKNTKQAGAVYGGLLTVMGITGMFPIFTAIIPGAGSASVKSLALIVPQGWGVQGCQLLLEGGGTSDVVSTFAVLLAWGVLFFVLGVLRFRKRFA